LAFPSTIETLAVDRVDNTATLTTHATDHNNENRLLNLIQAKIGVDGSAITTSHDYKLSGVAGTDKAMSLTGTEVATNKTYVSPIFNTWDGWIKVPDTWAYASATTITVPSGAATLYRVGDKIKLTQTTAKYFYVTIVADTLLTVNGGSDYTVANAAITLPFYSHTETPIGFPKYFNYAVTLASTGTGATVGNGTLTGRFKLVAATASVIINLTFGSTTAFGTGAPYFTPPIQELTAQAVSANGEDNGTAPFSMAARVTSNRIYIYYTNNYVNATNPFTWTTSDMLMVSGEYLTNL